MLTINSQLSWILISSLVLSLGRSMLPVNGYTIITTPIGAIQQNRIAIIRFYSKYIIKSKTHLSNQTALINKLYIPIIDQTLKK